MNLYPMKICCSIYKKENDFLVQMAALIHGNDMLTSIHIDNSWDVTIY